MSEVPLYRGGQQLGVQGSGFRVQGLGSCVEGGAGRMRR